ncbi:MAG: hypothetical protein AAF824_04765 [Bacteroidota bacterium]
MSIPRFITIILLLMIILTGMGYLIAQRYGYEPLAAVAAISLSGMLAMLAYTLSYKGLEKKETTTFVAYLLSGMLAKMLVGILTVVFIALEYKEVVSEYVVSFFLSYFVFTSFEVYGLMRKLRAKI